MPLKLLYPARSRLWAEVVYTNGERVFVPTTEALEVGATVAVEVEVADLAAPLVLEAQVLQQLPKVGAMPAGVFVQVLPKSVEHCRTLVGASRDEAARLAGRTEPRADCDFPARVLHFEPSGAAVKSLSPHGLTLKTQRPLLDHQEIAAVITLADGEALVAAKVMWSRPELMLAGLRITTVDDATLARLRATIDGLLGRMLAEQSSAATVVVADDDPAILDFTSRVVSKAGLRVVRADRGDVALELIRKEKPALVFLDVLMPGLDGVEVCKAMRQDVAFMRTPVVLLSAMGEDRLEEAAKDSGATAWLTKPMRVEALRELIAKHVRAHTQP